MRQHLEQRARQALGVDSEDAHRDHTHMGDGGVGDQLFHVRLREGDEGGVDHRDDRKREDERREAGGGVGQHGHREAQEAVSPHLQQHAGQDDGTGGGRFHVSIRQPGVHRPHRHLHREGGEEGEEQPGLHRHRELGLHQHGDIGAAGDRPHGEQGQQHEHRAGQGVEEELEGGIDPARAAPDADDEVHRDQHTFEEDVEDHEIQRAEHADHHGFQHQEGEHEFAHPGLDAFPAGEDAERGERGGEQDEEDGNPVHAHFIGDADRRQPVDALDKLEAGAGGVEPHPEQQREREDDQAGP